MELNVTLPAHPFDPTESVHEWTMWRAAVNRCIINKVIPSAEQTTYHTHTHSNRDLFLLHVPLRNFISMRRGCENRAHQMSGATNNEPLTLQQFVYFGLPRPKVMRDVSQGFKRFPIG